MKNRYRLILFFILSFLAIFFTSLQEKHFAQIKTINFVNINNPASIQTIQTFEKPAVINFNSAQKSLLKTKKNTQNSSNFFGIISNSFSFSNEKVSYFEKNNKHNLFIAYSFPKNEITPRAP